MIAEKIDLRVSSKTEIIFKPLNLKNFKSEKFLNLRKYSLKFNRDCPKQCSCWSTWPSNNDGNWCKHLTLHNLKGEWLKKQKEAVHLNCWMQSIWMDAEQPQFLLDWSEIWTAHWIWLDQMHNRLYTCCYCSSSW